MRVWYGDRQVEIADPPSPKITHADWARMSAPGHCICLHPIPERIALFDTAQCARCLRKIKEES